MWFIKEWIEKKCVKINIYILWGNLLKINYLKIWKIIFIFNYFNVYNYILSKLFLKNFVIFWFGCKLYFLLWYNVMLYYCVCLVLCYLCYDVVKGDNVYIGCFVLIIVL